VSPACTIRHRLAHWPEGYVTALYRGRTWGVTLSRHAGGRSLKLFGQELGGSDIVSLNLYDTGAAADPILRPCEMPVEKVLAFVNEAEPLPAPATI
jgi:hypothetical protein